MGDQVLVSDGVGDAVEQFFGGVEQPGGSFGVFFVIAVGGFVASGDVLHVVVAVEQHHLVFVFFLVVGDFEEVAFQFLEGEINVGFEVVADEDVDALFVNEPFPRVSAVDVSDDVVGGHGGSFLRVSVLLVQMEGILRTFSNGQAAGRYLVFFQMYQER